MITGTLRKNYADRWEIYDEENCQGWELTSGDTFEVQIAEHWIKTRIEYGIDGYYSAVAGIKLQNFLPARSP